MDHYVVIEWNCEMYEDRDETVVGVFAELQAAEDFIKLQPVKVTPRGGHRAPIGRHKRFRVEAFTGSTCHAVFQCSNDGVLKLDKSYRK